MKINKKKQLKLKYYDFDLNFLQPKDSRAMMLPLIKNKISTEYRSKENLSPLQLYATENNF